LARLLRIIGWALFCVSLLAGLFGVFGGPIADNYPWLSVCVLSWIISQFVLAFARRLTRKAIERGEDGM